MGAPGKVSQFLAMVSVQELENEAQKRATDFGVIPQWEVVGGTGWL